MSQLETIKEFNSWWKLRNSSVVQSLKAREDRKRTVDQRLSDAITKGFGNIYFLIGNLVWFSGWLILNLGFVKGVEPFDPYPFGMLTTIVSLEAIILAIFVLMTQNREARVNDLREEVDLHVDLVTEQEITKALDLLVKLLRKNGVNTENDEVLTQMLKPVDSDKLEEVLDKQV
jgi:uncharacterized membrane protein